MAVNGSQRVTYPCGITAAYTKMAWVNLTSLANANQNIITSETAPDHYFWFPSEGRLNHGVGGDFNAIQAAAGSYCTNGVWNHVAVTISGTTGRLFLNGEQIAERTNLGAFAGQASNAVVGVGVVGTSSGVNGRLDNVKIFNSALTAAQIRQIYHSELI
jgi:hypothetical protein